MSLHRVVSDGVAVFNFEYGPTAAGKSLAALYEQAKQEQWNAATDIDWGTPVGPRSRILEDERIAIYRTPLWDQLTAEQRIALNRNWSAWALSQTRHGEQAALMLCGQVAAAIPSIEGKYCMAAQVVDEARHMEVLTRYLGEKIGRSYPITSSLQELLDILLSDSRWYVKLIGIQLIVESLGVASFRNMRAHAEDLFIKQILGYILRDEARHVRFGVTAITHLVSGELAEREVDELAELAYKLCMLAAGRYFPREVYEESGFTERDIDQISELSRQSLHRQAFITNLFSVVMPNLKKVGLLRPNVLPHYERVGLLAVLEKEVPGG